MVQMPDFVLKNSLFGLNGEVERQKYGAAIGTKFAPLYACIFKDEVETELLKSQELKLSFGSIILTIYSHESWRREALSFLMKLMTFIPV